MYGLWAIWLAAAIAAFTVAGAFGGAIAPPSRRVAPQVELVLTTSVEVGTQLYPQGTACAAAPGAPKAVIAAAVARASAILFLIRRAIQKGYAGCP